MMYADADGATTFSELNKVYKTLNKVTNENKHGLVCGSRYLTTRHCKTFKPVRLDCH